MKNQMYTLGRVGIRALGMLAVCFSMSGCTDDYTLDDEMPPWLGKSVYQRLQQNGDFENYLQLMDNLGMKDVLNRTGSRTIFAANDSAFEAFFAHNATLPELNPWHNATSYDKLTQSQKALLAKSTMLNNAITMETLSTQETSLERGQYLRRPTLVSVADSVTYMRSSELPYSYNMTGDMDFWSAFRSQTYQPGADAGDGTGVYLTDGDGTNNMMLCFTREQMAKQNVTDEDFALVMGQEREPMDVFINDAKIMTRDITCQNGYINLMEKVVCPLPNMAEIIRTNGQTNIFSHILDRFSAPVYVQAYNDAYKLAHSDFEGKIYTKWYFSGSGTNSLEGNGVTTGTKDGVAIFRLTQDRGVDDYVEVPVTYSLKFDPSWNECSLVAGERAENDMAAMFVPCDETLLEAFQSGSLNALVEEYTMRNEEKLDINIGRELFEASKTATVNNLEPLYRAIDQIPMTILQAFVSNLMRESYNASVKSKFTTLKNDAQESLFGYGGCNVKDVALACNGAVYITSSFHAPADYSSVAAPAYLNSDKRVMRFAIYNGSNASETDYMRSLNYYAYLKAMTSRYTLFLPDDDAMRFIYNPMSFKSKNPRLVCLSYNKKFDTPSTATGNPINYEVWTYDIDEAKRKGTTYLRNASLTMDDIAGILTDVLQTHTLVHDTEGDLISQTRGKSLNERDRYYITKSHDAIKVTYTADGAVDYVQGGFQIENEQAGKEYDPDNLGTVKCNVKNASEYMEGGNGDTYVLDAPVIPAVKSVYGVLSEHEAYEPFLDICLGVDLDIIEKCGFFKKENGKDMETKDKEQLKKTTYSIFWEKEATLDYVTSFFNQYQYTVFVPTGEALDRARQEGFLYDWHNIGHDLIDHTDADPQDEGNDYTTCPLCGHEGLQPSDNFCPDCDMLLVDVQTRTFKSEEDSIRVKAKITHLFNFLRMHFMDNSVFADNTAWDKNNDVLHQNYATSCFYQTSATQGNFMKLHVKRLGGGNMTVQGMNVDMDGLCGTEANILSEYDLGPTGVQIPLKNIMAREITVVDASNNETTIRNQEVSKMNNKRIGSSSSAVVHLIDQTLRYTDEAPNFDNPSNARRYLKYNKVMNKSQQN